MGGGGGTGSGGVRGGKREGRTLVHKEGERGRDGGPYSHEYLLLRYLCTYDL